MTDPVMKTALAAQDFLEQITRMAHDKRLDADLVMRLFGHFAKVAVIEPHMAEGASETEAVNRVFYNFAQGLGIKMDIENVPGARPEH